MPQVAEALAEQVAQENLLIYQEHQSYTLAEVAVLLMIQVLYQQVELVVVVLVVEMLTRTKAEQMH
tara:strand:+ start:401 stop:598 length:198 start_codon:yes stop_codon:yes gene_type:complete